MANKIAIVYDDVKSVILDNNKIATNYKTNLTNSSKCAVAMTEKYALSDCKYFQNPGFVCPLKAYRAENLFFING